MNSTIKTFNLERFATHDGDGIRTVVFLQGCTLRCPWCANPESQRLTPALFFHKDKCVGCRTCEKLAKDGAIKFVDGKFCHDSSNIDKIKEAVEGCVSGALEIVGKETIIDEIVNEVMKDKDYYEASNGGVTISGGEAFTQFESFLELIMRLKENGLNVAVETCGNYSLEQLHRADPYIDAYLFDLKHLDEQIYRDVCKGDLRVVLRNIESLNPEKVTLRVPVIPDFNYNEKTLLSIIDYAKKRKVKALNFLPYHTLGKGKYEKMGLAYTWSDKALKNSDLEKYIVIAKDQGVSLKIGG